MASTRAARRAVPPSPPPAAALWAGLGRRQAVELTLPGASIGVLGGVIAGGMAAVGGLSLPLSVLAMLALAVPLGLAGAGYDVLLAQGRIPLGPLTPAALYWLVGFPVARVIHAALVSLFAGDPVAVPHGWLDYVVYQMLLSVGFAIGFWWLHTTIAPRWWFYLRHRNPVAHHFITEQLRYVGVMYQGQHDRRAAKAMRRRNR